MIIRHMCVYIVMVSGMLAGCVFGNYAPHEAPQADTSGTTLTDSYKDVASDGAIKAHPAPSYEPSQNQGRIDGSMVLGSPADLSDVSTALKQSTGAVAPSRPSPNTGSSRGSSK